MLRPRIIPVLLLQDNYVVKTTKFKNPEYVGDPINIIRIFSEKEVDEITIFDISLFNNKNINFKLIEDIASNARMPLCYGGGIKEVWHAEKLFSIGIEKISVSKSFFINPSIITEIIKEFGSQSVAITLDINTNDDGRYYIYDNVKTNLNSIENTISELNDLGVGEIIIQSVYKDGTEEGYDETLIEKLYNLSKAPITFVGGARSFDNIFEIANKYKIIGLGAGNIFIYKGKNKAVLLSYPNNKNQNNS